MIIPKNQRGLIKLAQEVEQLCNGSLGYRCAAYQEYQKLIETGKDFGGGLSLGNKLHSHIDRLASHLFCPTDARFTIDFENVYQKAILQQAEQVGRILTRSFNRHNFDIQFGGGLNVALGMGAAFTKIVGKAENVTIGNRTISHLKEASARIVPPWLIGVENEAKQDLSDQEAICETAYLSEWDVRRRIRHLPDHEKLWKRIQSHTKKTGESSMLPSSFVQVLSASQINISPQVGVAPSAGGIVQTAGSPALATVGPNPLANQFQMRELWLWDDDRQDYLMVQYIEPDILIAPLYKHTNEFCAGEQPFNKIQPNETAGYFWGRSEIVDLIMLQASLSETLDDFRKLIGVQYDKRYAFIGFDGDGDELYDDMRMAGWVKGRAGSEVKDLTPQLPAGAIEYIKLILSLMEDVGGFGNILSGQGEAGVRAGNHADTLVKTASPRLRDRSLITERNYAAFGDKYLHYLEAKDGNQYYTDPEKPDESAFLLDQLPDDRRVMVDSHSSSPIYESDHNAKTSFALKSGLIDGARAIDMLNLPDKDEAKREWKDREAAKQKLIEAHPELLARGAGGRARK